MTPSKHLKDLLYQTMKDIYFAEKELLKALDRMAQAARSLKLKSAFQTQRNQTEDQIRRLEQAFGLIGEVAEGKTSKAILGMIAEGKEVMEEFEGTDALDPGLIAGAQAIKHYEISRYSTMIAWASLLGFDHIALLFAETLDEEEDADEQLCEIAEAAANEMSE